MSKTASMTIRIEDELRQQFNEAATRAHRPAAQVVRDFMREFVEKSLPRKPMTLTPEELERREAVDFALANSELEGYETSAAQNELFERFARGEITGEELGKEVDRMADEFLATTRQ
jgi:antitoxin component of RelBE/YafQ-DinJ toxin-antitoxin module